MTILQSLVFSVSVHLQGSPFVGLIFRQITARVLGTSNRGAQKTHVKHVGRGKVKSQAGSERGRRRCLPKPRALETSAR